MEKPGVLKASTPASHPLIRAAWLAGWVLLLTAALGAVLGVPLAAPLALAAAGLFVAGLVGYLARHLRFLVTLARAERALALGDEPTARSLVAPLLDRTPGFPAVQRISGLVLYRAGDPLSAATLLEAAARAHRDRDTVATLTAAYAALNKAGDARRSAALLPTDPDVRLALAWAELVALGGDRARGAALVAALPADTPGRQAMAAALRAVVAARAGDPATVRRALRAAEERYALLAPDERAFLGYLGGVALREAGALADARETFGLALAAAPDSIGAALARRERTHLGAEVSSPSSSAPSQPSSD